MKVLIVVDIQNDFCPGGSLAVIEGNDIVPLVNRLMREGGYDARIASKDWHPGDHGSFAANHPGKNVFEDTMLNGLSQKLWPVHCVQNSPGAEFVPGLATELFDVVIRKGQDPKFDSYSAFADNGGRATELRRLLLELQEQHGGGIEIDVVGLALDYCVMATAVDGAELGMKVNVIFDATRAVDQRDEAIAKVLRELSDRNVAVIASSERLPIVRMDRPIISEIPRSAAV